MSFDSIQRDAENFAADWPTEVHKPRALRALSTPNPRDACQPLSMLAWSRTSILPMTAAVAMRWICDLSHLPNWWPQAQSLQPLPPGMCGPGDRGLLRVAGHDTLLRVAALRARRVLLIQSAPWAMTTLDLKLTPTGCDRCSLAVRVERPAPYWWQPFQGRTFVHFADALASRLERQLVVAGGESGCGEVSP